MIKNNSKFFTRVCLALACLVTVTISACKKDNSETSAATNQTAKAELQLILGKTWTTNSVILTNNDGSKVTRTDGFATLDIDKLTLSSNDPRFDLNHGEFKTAKSSGLFSIDTLNAQKMYLELTYFNNGSQQVIIQSPITATKLMLVRQGPVMYPNADGSKAFYSQMQQVMGN